MFETFARATIYGVVAVISRILLASLLLHSPALPPRFRFAGSSFNLLPVVSDPSTEKRRYEFYTRVNLFLLLYMNLAADCSSFFGSRFTTILGNSAFFDALVLFDGVRCVSNQVENVVKLLVVLV